LLRISGEQRLFLYQQSKLVSFGDPLVYTDFPPAVLEPPTGAQVVPHPALRDRRAQGVPGPQLVQHRSCEVLDVLRDTP
jgi:hypothetical protein